MADDDVDEAVLVKCGVEAECGGGGDEWMERTRASGRCRTYMGGGRGAAAWLDQQMCELALAFALTWTRWKADTLQRSN